MEIIGLAAKIGAGKDTAHQLLTEYYESQGYKCTKLSFAKALKDICVLMFHWDRQRLEDDFQYKEGNTLDDGTIDPACRFLDMTRRQVMQHLGTEAMRNGLHSDIWIITLQLAIERGDYDDYDYGFVTDCRFQNELAFVKQLKGKCVKINRIANKATLSDETDHISELEWEKWDDWFCTVDNVIDDNLSEEQNKENFKKALIKAIG